MAIAVLFEFPTGSVEDYLKVFQIGGDAIVDQPDRRFHTCYRTDGGFTVVDVWDSEDAFAAFGAVIGPVMAQIGLDAAPKVYPVQRTVDAAGTVRDA